MVITKNISNPSYLLKLAVVSFSTFQIICILIKYDIASESCKSNRSWTLFLGAKDSGIPGI